MFVNVLPQSDWIKSVVVGENPQQKIWEREVEDAMWTRSSSSKLHVFQMDFCVIITFIFVSVA